MTDTRGYYRKYDVFKSCRCGDEHCPASEYVPLAFVLEFTTDPIAREAAIFYAVRTGNSKLQADLQKLFDKLGPVKEE